MTIGQKKANIEGPSQQCSAAIAPAYREIRPLYARFPAPPARGARASYFADRFEVVGDLLGGPYAAFTFFILTRALHHLEYAHPRAGNRQDHAGHVVREAGS